VNVIVLIGTTWSINRTLALQASPPVLVQDKKIGKSLLVIGVILHDYTARKPDLELDKEIVLEFRFLHGSPTDQK